MKKVLLLATVLLANKLYQQNTCATAVVINQTSLPYASGALTTCGTGNDYGVGAGSCNTTYGAGEDYVFVLNITSAPVTLNFSLGGAAAWKILQVFNACPAPAGAPSNCLGNFTTGGGTTGSGNFTFPSNGAYYIVVDTWPSPTCGAFTMGINPPPSCPSGFGTGYTQIPTLPFNSGATTNCGMVNDFTSANLSPLCGSSLYYGGEDAVYSFTPTTTGTVNITVTSTGSYMGLALYQGCPFSGGSCVASAQSSAGNQTMCPNVSAGQVYYLIIDSWPAPNCNPYTLDISSCNSPPAGGTANSSTTSVCTSGNTVALSVSGSVGGCGVSYQWQTAPVAGGPWSNIVGATSATYAPSITGNVCYRRRTACAAGSGTSTSICLNVAACAAPTGGNAVATPTAACASGGTVSLSVTGSSSGCGYTFQWQSATNAGGPWTNIAGATNSVAVGTVAAPTTCFRRIIMCGASSATSAAVCVSPGNCVSQLGNGVVNVASLPYSNGAGSTCGSGNDLTSANVNVTGCSSSSYFTGEDQVFIFTPTSSGNITISLTSAGSWTGLMLYNTCPLSCSSSAGCVASSTSSTGNKTLVACVNAGTTYYLVLDSFAAPSCNAYSALNISAPGAISPSSNDVCAAATPMTSGGTIPGNTAGYTPDTPGNLTSLFCGSIENNQWFSFTANAATATFSISGISGTSCGAGVQAQVFSVNTSTGICTACNSFTSVSTPCYNPGTLTAGQVTATGLTVGQTYYLMVDGNGGAQCFFTIGGWTTAPLPVTLITFQGANISVNTNKIYWKVAQEKDLQNYIVQRSVDGVNFFDTGEVLPFNSHVQSNYEFYDSNAPEGVNYYRLVMVEKNGERRNSRIIAINSNGSGFEINKLFPNPTNSMIYASLEVFVVDDMKMTITDVFGKTVFSKSLSLTAGTNIIDADVSQLCKGVYFARFETTSNVRVSKFSVH